MELCGFGAIGAAVSTLQHLPRRPAQVCLIGIAGTYDPHRCPVGTAWQFSSVHCEVVGAAAPGQLQVPSQLGFPQWTAKNANVDAPANVFESLDLSTPDPQSPSLLTVGHASGSLDAAAQRQLQFPSTIAEDMEGFGVALACHTEGTPCSILRGISNVAGQRDLSTWQMESAFDSLAELIQQRFFASS